jgi:hypothetical protein
MLRFVVYSHWVTLRAPIIESPKALIGPWFQPITQLPTAYLPCIIDSLLRVRFIALE